MIIEANITIDMARGVDVSALVSQIETILSEVNGEATRVNIIDVDDPVSTNPLNYRVRV